MILYGHRGAKNEAPENTLPGFAWGLEAGLTAFETDVRLTADNELVLLHDATVDRTTNGTGAVADLTLAQLQQLDARGSDFPQWPVPCRIPTLEAMFGILPPGTRLEIEIKRDIPERLDLLVPRLLALLERLATPDTVTVTSFAPEALTRVRALAPHWPRCLIGAYDTPAFLQTALELGCSRAGIHLLSSSRETVQAVQAAGLGVTGWPGDTIEQIQILHRDWQVDAITTNFPTRALAYFAEQ